MFALLWVLLIRPQRRRQQAQQQLLSSVEPGDEVLTVGGLYGIVQELDEENDLIVEIAEGIRVRIARRAVAGVVKPDEEDDIVDGEAIEDHGDAGEAAIDNDDSGDGAPPIDVDPDQPSTDGSRRIRLRGRRPQQ